MAELFVSTTIDTYLQQRHKNISILLLKV